MAAATITFTADQALLDAFVRAACAAYGYAVEIPDPGNPGNFIPNPQTPAQFAQQCVINYCTDIVRAYQVSQAAEAARQAAMHVFTQQINNSPITATFVGPQGPQGAQV